jgi:hypothetical protein
MQASAIRSCFSKFVVGFGLVNPLAKVYINMRNREIPSSFSWNTENQTPCLQGKSSNTSLGTQITTFSLTTLLHFR